MYSHMNVKGEKFNSVPNLLQFLIVLTVSSVA